MASDMGVIVGAAAVAAAAALPSISHYPVPFHLAKRNILGALLLRAWASNAIGWLVNVPLYE